MPKSSKAKLEYQREYNARPENVAKSVKNNAARREAIREGKARVGDRKENCGWRKKHGDMYD